MTSPSPSSLALGPPAARIPLLLRRLRRTYQRPLHARRRDPLDTLIGTVLSQNTTDANSGRAFHRLKQRFPDWHHVLAARPRQIASTIRAGGLADVKSGRIKQILTRIEQDRGVLDLGFLRRLPLQRAADYLEALPGVGPKTAACVLLFSLGKPAFPVDTHVLRVSKRLGLLHPHTTMDRAHEIYRDLLTSPAAGAARKSYRAADMLTLHLGLVQHGREVCVARRPRCEICSLSDLCPRIGLAAHPPAAKEEP